VLRLLRAIGLNGMSNPKRAHAEECKKVQMTCGQCQLWLSDLDNNGEMEFDLGLEWVALDVVESMND